MNILYFEDNVPFSQTMSSLLTAHGHNITCVHDGKNDLDTFKNNADFDCIITDFNMPGMNGDELFRNIRKYNANIPVILFCGDVWQSKESFTHVVGKFEIPYLIEVLKKLEGKEH